jgi:hypothetical protein
MQPLWQFYPQWEGATAEHRDPKRSLHRSAVQELLDAARHEPR